jgi:hypothetical protein
MNEPRDTALKRLRMRSWRRGMKEMDLILGPFADAELARLTGTRSRSTSSFCRRTIRISIAGSLARATRRPDSGRSSAGCGPFTPSGERSARTLTSCFGFCATVASSFE